MRSHKKTKFPRVSEKQRLETFQINIFRVFCFVLFCFVFFFTLRGKLISRLTKASIIDEKKILIEYDNRCEGPDRLASPYPPKMTLTLHLHRSLSFSKNMNSEFRLYLQISLKL